MTLIWLCCAWLLGVVGADLLGLPTLPLAVVGGSAAFLAPLWRRSRVYWPLVLLAAFGLGAARGAAARPVTDETAVWAHADKSVILTGSVVEQPIWRDDDQIVIIAAESIETAGKMQTVHGHVRLALGVVPELQYGQRITATGRLRQPPTNGSFDFRAYLARQSIYVLMQQPRIGVQGRQSDLTPLGPLLRLNARLQKTVQRLLPEPHAGLLSGILLGTQSALPRPVLEEFRTTGTSHLLVISGWNISIVIKVMIGAFLTLGFTRRAGAVCSLPVLIAYVLLVGASPSVMRAGIMGALVVWAEVADREADAWTGLALACALLALIDPHVLWDVGFQLAALSTAGILAWATPMRTWFTQWAPLKSGLAAGPIDALSATLAATVLVLPILLHNFGNLSLVAPLANVLLAPAVPPAMLFGGIAAAASLLSLATGQLLALVAWPFTAWMLGWTSVLAHLPGAVVDVPSFPLWAVWLWYAIAGGLAWRRYQLARP